MCASRPGPPRPPDPEAGVEQIGAVGEQAVGKKLPAPCIDAVGEFVGPCPEEPRLLQRPVGLALAGGEAASLRGDGRVLGGAPGRGSAELRQTIGDRLEAGFEGDRLFSDPVTQRRQALPERNKLVLGAGICHEAVLDVVELGLDGIEVRTRRPLRRNGRHGRRRRRRLDGRGRPSDAVPPRRPGRGCRRRGRRRRDVLRGGERDRDGEPRQDDRGAA